MAGSSRSDENPAPVPILYVPFWDIVQPGLELWISQVTSISAELSDCRK
ncbi:hypothetical protein MGWOODY_XGa820 [hydrothermal vent metagenome]|uniref:Uncharacterized protein n=1 Tax=hydrothermal vent metagenome TaxID=652676 RepID=A0A160TV45_9ZZZZ